jgi:hypothetical protein
LNNKYFWDAIRDFQTVSTKIDTTHFGIIRCLRFQGRILTQNFFRNGGIHQQKYTASHTEGVTNYLMLLNLALNYHNHIPRPFNLIMNHGWCNSL